VPLALAVDQCSLHGAVPLCACVLRPRQPVASGTAVSSVPLFGTMFVSPASRKLVTINPTTGAWALKSTLSFNPQCACHELIDWGLACRAL
jgi:hypothetical protein